MVSNPTVKVLHIEGTLALFFNLDQTFYITITALQLAEMDEAKLALLVSHELAHYLMDHNVYRMGVSLIQEKVFNNQKLYKKDPIKRDFMARTKLHSYSDYYPQQRIVSKFMQRNCDTLAVTLWKNAYPDVDHETIIEELVEDKITQHLRSVPHLDERETYFNPDYTYKRAETLLQLVRRQHSRDDKQAAAIGEEMIEKLK